MAFGASSLAVPTPQPIEARDVLPDGQTVGFMAFYDQDYQGTSFGGGHHYNECCESNQIGAFAHACNVLTSELSPLVAAEQTRRARSVPAGHAISGLEMDVPARSLV